MDGLPGMQRGVKTALTDSVKPMKKMVGRYAPINGERRRPTRVYTLGHLILAALVGVLISVGLFVVLLRLESVAVCFGKECSQRRWEGLFKG